LFPQDLPGAVRAARSEAGASFGDPAIFIERQVVHARHIEVQVLGDRAGTIVPFVERECSLQRRHQKVIEESPSAVMSPELRSRITAAAAGVARTAGYTNAGTLEFLLDDAGHFYFLEMNTRLQVEHPVTEMVTGIDLVEWQIRIARGEQITFDPSSVLTPRGHAIECRIIAEDADAGFMPSPGRISGLRVPSGPGIRNDGAIEAGEDVPIFYDAMISKLIAWGETRAQAIARMRRALSEYEVTGIRTSIPFCNWMLNQPEFATAMFDTDYLDTLLRGRQGAPFLPLEDHGEELAAIAAALYSASQRPAPGAGAAARSSDRGGGVTVPRSDWRGQGIREGLRQ
jgi:acetyl-CoA carboxylase, biotin carboxylase subunit